MVSDFHGESSHSFRSVSTVLSEIVGSRDQFFGAKISVLHVLYFSVTFVL